MAKMVVWDEATTITPEKWNYALRLGAIHAKVSALRSAGHSVGMTDVTGLWRIDGGPELTTNQLLGMEPTALQILSRGRASS